MFATNASMDGRLAEISAPTLVLTGDSDVGSTPEMAEVMAAEIPDSHLVVLNDTRHLPPVEHPAETAEVLRTFFRAQPASISPS